MTGDGAVDEGILTESLQERYHEKCPPLMIDQRYVGQVKLK